MRVRPSRAQRAAVLSLCAALLLPYFPCEAVANDGPRIVIQIGQPSVWSLGQAHYLLAKMHRTDKKLRTRFPTDEDLDSNKIAATRIEALRSSLGIEGQFDQAMGVKNNLALRRFREGEVRRETSRADLRARQADLQQANADLLALNEQIAVLQEEDRQSTEARGRTTPPTPPTADDNTRKTEIERLKVRRTRKTEERDELKTQVTSLQTTVDTPTPAPTLEEPALSTGNGALPTSETFDAFLEKAVAEAGKPDLSATMKLDNFVQMQYEIISKQLTLLRDEVGPEDRVIFLELPASIYTVDKKADNYVAQVEWDVETVCDREPPADIQGRAIYDMLQKEGRSEEQIEETMMRIDKAREVGIELKARRQMQSDEESLTRLRLAQARLNKIEGLTDAQRKAQYDNEEKQVLAPYVQRVRQSLSGKGSAPYPITLAMIENYIAASTDSNSPHYGEKPCPDVDRKQARAIDIIPRLSALNVNERHAVVKQTMILAAFKFLIGFAAKVNYQRQRELYEQFVQQQVFASGYGKGDDTFGWTYGPQPGTKRIATGERTTFAVLVVPRNTLAVRLKARSRYYKMGKSPQDPDFTQFTSETDFNTSVEGVSGDVIRSAPSEFFLSVPGKRTQEFWVDGVSYTPVRKGRRVTVLVDGNYFSPQLGILVNGVPLEPVLSVSRIAGSDEEADVTSADGVAGEYEVTNSRQIVLSFKMPDDYVGTPMITFTSPEKSTAINFFDLDINHHPANLISLQERSLREPMFIEEFTDKQEIEVIKTVPVVDKDGNRLNATGGVAADETSQAKFKLVRVKGAGMRPGADVLLNENVVGARRDFDTLAAALDYVNQKPTPTVPFVMQDSTRSYILYFPDPGKDKWNLSYRQLTRQGYEEGGASKEISPSFATSVRNYRFIPGTGRAEVDLTFTSAKTISTVELDDPPPSQRNNCQGVKPGGENKYRVKCFVPADNGGKLERDFITVKVSFAPSGERYEDIRLPVRPAVTSLVNLRTGQAVGYADEEPTVVLSGFNLQNVKSVFFGDKEAKVLAASADSITVKVPKGAAVPKGQAAAVPVSLQGPGAQPVPSGAVYTYLGEPPTPNVIVWPYPTGRP